MVYRNGSFKEMITGSAAPVSSRFIFVFALSQFSGPDYLGAWNRLYSEALQGVLHFFRQQREQTLVTLCYWDFLGRSQSESVLFIALHLYYFWLLENSVLFVSCSAACIKRCAHSLSTSPSMILTRGGDSVAYTVTFYFWRTRNSRGGGGEIWVLGSEVWGLSFPGLSLLDTPIRQ